MMMMVHDSSDDDNSRNNDDTDNNDGNNNNTMHGSRSTYAKRSELKVCSQCKHKVWKADMKRGRYPKERFIWNQTHRKKGTKSASISDYLVCTDCFDSPQCIGCACVPHIGNKNAVCCSETCASINLDNAQTDDFESRPLKV